LAFPLKEPYYVNLRTKVRGTDTERETLHPIFPPHEVLDHIAHQDASIIDNALLGPGGLDGIKQFWDDHSHVSWCQNHPVMRLSEEELSWALPLELFGDDASIWKHEKLLILSWRSSLWKTTKTLWTTFLICVLPLALVVPGKTLNDLHAAIQWSFTACLLGTWPRRTHSGQIMRKKHGKTRFQKRGQNMTFRAALTRATGDYKYHAETYNLRGYGHASCCHRCRATKTNPDLLYTEVGPTARWHAFPRSHEEYMHEQGDDVNPLCRIPGWHLHMVKVDLMHNFFLGTVLHLVASAVVQMADEGWFGQATLPKKTRLREAYARFAKWKRDGKFRCSVACFTPAALKWTSRHSYPEWASSVKAHNARMLLAWLALETSKDALNANQRRPDERTLTLLRAHTVSLGARYAYEMDMQPRSTPLSQHVADNVAQVGYAFLLGYMDLARNALEQGRCLYAVKPKMHQSHT